ncbi:hypothetical protein ACIPLC_36920 [Kitasatospora sp. NPDC086801]
MATLIGRKFHVSCSVSGATRQDSPAVRPEDEPGAGGAAPRL